MTIRLKNEIIDLMNEIVLFTACLCSFATVLISLMFFLRFKKIFFIHVLMILLSFFLISANSLYVEIYKSIDSRIFLCIFGGALCFCFSYGILNFAFDLIRISPTAVIRKIVMGYAALVFLFAIALIFITQIQSPSSILNIIGIWIPSFLSVLIGLIFYRRIDKGVFHKEKWIFIILAILNISLSFVLHNAPFIFIIFVSLLIYHIFYRFYFSSPISKTEKSIKEEFIKDFSITKREREVILALLDGKSNKELAETLFVSEKTIEAHLANIYRKVGVKNRLELFSRLQDGSGTL